VLSDASGAWQYLPFLYGGQPPTTEALGGNPRFDGGTLVSDSDCAASVPQDQRVTSTWTYDPSSGDLTAAEQPGWPPSPWRPPPSTSSLQVTRPLQLQPLLAFG
jgi:hypothetical protein